MNLRAQADRQQQEGMSKALDSIASGMRAILIGCAITVLAAVLIGGGKVVLDSFRNSEPHQTNP